jgi:hypothetical protein
VAVTLISGGKNFGLITFIHLYPALSTLIHQGDAVRNQGVDQGANQGGRNDE